MPGQTVSGGGLDSTVTPVVKKRKVSGSPTLHKTPIAVLEQVKNGDPTDDDRKLHALYNTVIAAGLEDEEDEESVTLLTELLAVEGVDPNAGDAALLDKFGGGPLYQACALDLPDTTRALLEHGASVVREYKGVTPLEVALGRKGSRCVKVIMDHIEKLEKQARAGRKRG